MLKENNMAEVKLSGFKLQHWKRTSGHKDRFAKKSIHMPKALDFYGPSIGL